MYYVVQENIFRDYNYNNLLIALNRLDLSHEIVSIYPNRETIIFETERKDVFPFGGLKMARISKQYDWKPGTQMNDNHDFIVYKEKYKEHLLNYDSKVIKFGDLDSINLTDFFARPTKDTKSFTGKIYSFKEWKEYQENVLSIGNHPLLNKDTDVQISTIKPIQQEIRVWIVKGEVITASQYKLGDQVLYSSNVDSAVIDYCKEMIKIFQLNDAFVMDICLTNNEYKIIECNCLNCAGFYQADLQKLLFSLENAW